jgi:hypothetical protein
MRSKVTIVRCGRAAPWRPRDRRQRYCSWHAGGKLPHVQAAEVEAMLMATRSVCDDRTPMTRSIVTAVKNLRRAPGRTVLVVVTLALGIGAATAMFSVVDAVLINPLPFAKGHRLVEIWTYFQEGATRAPGATREVMAAIRNESAVFEAVGAYQFGAGTITGEGEPELVSPNNSCRTRARESRLWPPSRHPTTGSSPVLRSWVAPSAWRFRD